MKLRLSIIGLFVFSLLFVFTSCSNKKVSESVSDSKAAITDEPVEPEVVEEVAPIDDSLHRIKIITSHGNMVAELFNETPKHRDNFIKLVKNEFFNNLIFHRVIKDFMIQGGDPNSKNPITGKIYGDGGPGYTIPAEINTNLHFHKKGALSAARMGDEVNPNRESSGSQFYIVQGKVSTPTEMNNYKNYGYSFSDAQVKAYTTIGGTPHLDGQYSVFGQVIDGLDVIDKIASVPTNKNLGDRPVKDIFIKMEYLGKFAQ